MTRADRLRSTAGMGGFTLIEMLVSLALMAMISALLWQATQQVVRVEQLLQRSGVDGQLDAVRREWLRGLVQASLVEQGGAPRKLKGDARQFTVASAEALSLPGAVSGLLQIRLDTESRSGQQRLVVAAVSDVGDSGDAAPRATAEPVELLAWRGKPGVIQFIAADGRRFDHWPPPPAVLSAATAGGDDDVRRAQAATPRLPRAVLLDLGADVGGPLVVSLSVTESGRLTRSQWERL